MIAFFVTAFLLLVAALPKVDKIRSAMPDAVIDAAERSLADYRGRNIFPDTGFSCRHHTFPFRHLMPTTAT